MKHYPSLANVITQADCSQGLNVRSAEGKAIACQSTEGQRRLERSGRHLRGRIDQSGGRGGRLNVDSGLPAQCGASPATRPTVDTGRSESRSDSSLEAKLSPARMSKAGPSFSNGSRSAPPLPEKRFNLSGGRIAYNWPPRCRCHEGGVEEWRAPRMKKSRRSVMAITRLSRRPRQALATGRASASEDLPWMPR